MLSVGKRSISEHPRIPKEVGLLGTRCGQTLLAGHAGVPGRGQTCGLGQITVRLIWSLGLAGSEVFVPKLQAPKADNGCDVPSSTFPPLALHSGVAASGGDIFIITTGSRLGLSG